jgi:YggT family protein
MSAHRRSEGKVIGTAFLWFANLLITALLIAILARAVISWLPIDPRSPIVTILNDVTEPVLAPLRKVVPRIGMIDITPMVAFIVLVAIQRAIGT